MITLNNLSKKYGNDVILDSVSYTFPQKGLVCLMGASGGGKTTLLNLIAGFDSDYQGEIVVGGSPLNQMDADALCEYRRTQIGFVFQNYHLLTGYSALENILLSAELSSESKEQSSAKAKELLGRLGLADKMNQSCETLSGGQKQRVAIARALMGDPQLILADEPTGALDRTTSTEIMLLLQEISKEKLVVVITHDEKILSFADEVLRIKEKKLLSEKQTAHCDLPSEAKTVTVQARGAAHPMRRAAKNFKVHLKRYLAVATAISIGVLAFLFALSSSNVMEQSIQKFKDKNTAFNNGYIKGIDDGTILNVLEQDERIENVYYQYKLGEVHLSVDGKEEMMPEKFPMPKATEALSYGTMPRIEMNEIALTPSLAKKFAADMQSLLGKTLTLTLDGKEYQLKISGIYNAGYDDFFVSSDIEQALYEGTTEENNYSISYDVKEFDDIVAVSNMLKQRGINSQNVAKEVFALQETFRSLTRLFLIVSVLVLLIALFLCTVLLVKLQNTRYREMGLLSALGFHKKDIGAIVWGENLMLSGFAAGMNAVLFCAAALVCKLIGFPFAVGAAQFMICVAAAFFSIMTISGAASFRLIRTEPAVALRK